MDLRRYYYYYYELFFRLFKAISKYSILYTQLCIFYTQIRILRTQILVYVETFFLFSLLEFDKSRIRNFEGRKDIELAARLEFLLTIATRLIILIFSRLFASFILNTSSTLRFSIILIELNSAWSIDIEFYTYISVVAKVYTNDIISIAAGVYANNYISVAAGIYTNDGLDSVFLPVNFCVLITPKLSAISTLVTR